MKIKRKIIAEVARRFLKESKLAEEEAATGAWPPKPPKNHPLSEKGGPSPKDVATMFQKLASMSPPQDAEKELAQIGGPKVLAQNYIALQKKFAGSGSNPDRIKMPVVDPDKGDIADDGGDVGARMAKGQLDLKPPFTKENVQRIAKVVMERLAERRLLREQDPAPEEEAEEATGLDTVFPQDLLGDKERSEKFLTKGERDGSPTDDSAVTMKKDTIAVKDAKPSQKQIYVDKSLWNILNYTGTAPGKTAHGDADMIAVKAGGEYIILDGHHRWSSAFLSGGPTARVNVQVVEGLDIDQAIAAFRAYGNARGNQQKG